MKQVISFLLLCLLISTSSFASDKSDLSLTDDKAIGFVGLGTGVVAIKQNNDRAWDAHLLLALRGGVDIGNHEVFGEISGFRTDSSSSGVDVTDQHEQYDLWYRYLFTFQNSNARPFLGAAVGLQRDKVKTDFFGDAVEDVGELELQGSVAAGLKLEGNPVTIWFEARLSTSRNYEPSLEPTALAAIGFVF